MARALWGGGTVLKFFVQLWWWDERAPGMLLMRFSFSAEAAACAGSRGTTLQLRTDAR
jgi:hypothetical protein